MLISPENIKLNQIVKKVKLNFSTPNKLYGNLLFLLTNKYEDYGKIFNANLFKPNQLASIYTPRVLKPLNTSTVHVVQQDIYSDIADKTNNFLKLGRVIYTAYSNRNLVYDITNEYNVTLNKLETLKKTSIAKNQYLQEFIADRCSQVINTFNYEKSFLIIPLISYIPDLVHITLTNSADNTNPVVEFIRTFRKMTANAGIWNKYKNFDRIFFYNPSANAMLAIDPKDPELSKDITSLLLLINRLNNYNNNDDNLDDISDDDVSTEESIETAEADEVENSVEKIKQIVIKNVGNTLKANLDDYDTSTPEEKTIVASIDNRIDSYLSDKNNKNKTYTDLVQTIQKDPQVTAASIQYVESKKIAQKQTAQLSRNLEKENKIVDSVLDLQHETDDLIEPEKINKNTDATDINNTTLISFDKEYNNKYLLKDIMSVLTAFSDQSYAPITLIRYEMPDTSDAFTAKYTLSCSYKTVDGQQLSFRLDIPKIIDERYVKIKGNSYVIQKQLLRLPIVKTKSDTVEITTNFNKIICSRVRGKISRENAYLRKLLKDYKNPKVNIVFGNNSIANSMYTNDFGYDELSSFLYSISNSIYEISTSRKDVEKRARLLELPEGYLDRNITPVGFDNTDKDNPKLLVIDNSDQSLYEIIPGEKPSANKISENIQSFIVSNILGLDPNDKIAIGKSYAYSKCEFIAVTYPIFVLCGLYEGILSVLQRAKIKWHTSTHREPYRSNWVEVKFKNKYFYYEDKLTSSLLLNILYAMDTENYTFEDFNTPDPYVDYCVNSLGQPMYVKNTVLINLSKLVDPITRQILDDFHMPNDPVSLLIMANNMLANNFKSGKMDLNTYRLRGNELIADKLYNILSAAYMTYQRARMNGSNKATLKINQNAMITAFTSELRNIKLNAVLNPILETENVTGTSARGFRGVNISRAYTVDMRNFNPTMVGILSANDTPFSGSVGTNRSLTFNPNITSVRGYIIPKKFENVKGTEILSASELLSVGTAAHADPSRAAMVNGQAKHIMPVKETNRALFGYGIEKTLPYMLSDDFAFKAKFSGIIDNIDEKNKLCILKYDNGDYDAIDLSETLDKNSNSGFYINQEFLLKYNVGERFKEGDVIAYNPNYFSGKGENAEYNTGTLSKFIITSGDMVFEDATMISENLGKRMQSKVTMNKSVVLGPNTIIQSIAKVGDHVNVGDPLVSFTRSFDDKATSAFIADLIDTIGKENTDELGMEVATAKYAGIISDIDIYYNLELSKLSPSLQRIIKDYIKNIKDRSDELQKYGISPAALHMKPTDITRVPKINGVEFPEDTGGVIIMFYITHDDKLSAGDKLTYGIALKGVCSTIIPDKDKMFSEYRPSEMIDGANASGGVLGRFDKSSLHI